MALSATTKRAVNVAMATHAAGAEVTTALDANTLKTSMPTVATMTASSGTATTTWLSSKVSELVTKLKAKSHMAS